LKKIFARESLRVAGEHWIICLRGDNASRSYARFIALPFLAAQRGVRRLAIGFAVFLKGLGAIELDSIELPVYGVPGAGDIVARSRDRLLIACGRRYGPPPRVEVDWCRGG
jgi:hypothetical protein